MSDIDLVAVFDMGKTHTRLSIADPRTGRLLSQARRANQRVLRHGWAQLDLAAAQPWLVDTLAASPHRARIGALVPVAHGAACVLVDRQGRVLAAPDYEDQAFDTLRDDYDRQRDPFAETCSPRLPAGLNLGAQLHALERLEPALWSAADRVLLLPQYWAWQWSGEPACELTSLGCHSDLWQPAAGRWSSLAERRGWDRRLGPLRPAGQALGLLKPALARATGLPASCRVLCGLHDSNAAWLAQRRAAGGAADLTLLSSGTWVIAMSSGAPLSRLREDRDMLANVDALGHPLPTARFMGGREFAALCGVAPAAAAGPADLAAVLAAHAMALPSFVPAGGPFRALQGRRLRLEGLTPPQRRAAATLYLALVTEVMLELLGAAGPLVIDGPLAADAGYPALLQALRPRQPVSVAGGGDGTVAGALALLDAGPPPPRGEQAAPPAAIPFDLNGLADYRAAWREAVSLADPALGLAPSPTRGRGLG
jgi:sugar (pentulose or hexulose) kinase